MIMLFIKKNLVRLEDNVKVLKQIDILKVLRAIYKRSSSEERIDEGRIVAIYVQVQLTTFFDDKIQK